ncbi:hypothetical protein HDU83_008280 [Entophlyctis luteolus]|nr:hypothetical protein HDU83_008280 [Entophlyctis luteolus]
MADFEDEFDDIEALPEPRSDYELNAAVQGRLKDVRAFISRYMRHPLKLRLFPGNSFTEAVSKALEDPPAGRDSQVAKSIRLTDHKRKDQNLQVVMEAVSAPRSADVPGVVKQLANTQLDELMKFLYRGMALPETYNSSVLLGWHEKVPLSPVSHSGE